MKRVETFFPVAAGALALAFGFGACAETNLVGNGGLGGTGGSTEDVVYVTSSKTSSTGASSETVIPNGGSSVDKGAGGGGGDGGGPLAVCGDTNCDPSEACNVCIADCGTCPAVCGDGECNGTERCDTCQLDCGACPASCGDGTCDMPTETCMNCEGDCGACANVCGDGTCTMPAETCENCIGDCGVCPCVADANEPNQNSPAATPINAGVDECMLSICTNDVDWFEFDVPGSATVTITFQHAFGDLDLEIYSASNGDYVDGSYSGNDDEEVVLSGVAAGTYYARVYGYESGGVHATNYAYCIRVD